MNCNLDIQFNSEDTTEIIIDNFIIETVFIDEVIEIVLDVFPVTVENNTTIDANWGDIYGDISQQTDLINKLNSKSDTNHTHSELHTHSNKTTLDKLGVYNGELTYDGQKVDTDNDEQNASEVSVDTTNFSQNLSSADDTVQKALETLDGLTSFYKSDNLDTSQTDYWYRGFDVNGTYTINRQKIPEGNIAGQSVGAWADRYTLTYT